MLTEGEEEYAVKKQNLSKFHKLISILPFLATLGKTCQASAKWQPIRASVLYSGLLKNGYFIKP